MLLLFKNGGKPPWRTARTASNMLTEERLCKRRSGAASMQLYGGCAPLPAALPEPRSSQILRAACAKPSTQSLGDARTCVSSYGISWARS
eukprot:scaffold45753_cov97-Phaeocystis_antarctica.AAC.9